MRSFLGLLALVVRVPVGAAEFTVDDVVARDIAAAEGAPGSRRSGRFA